MTLPANPRRDERAARKLARWLAGEWRDLGGMCRAAAVLCALAAAVLIGLGAWTDWVKEAKEPPLRVAAAVPEKTSEVVAVAWLDPQGEDAARLWIVFRNDADGAASNLRYLKLDTPGFDWVTCMEAGGPDCRPRGRGRHPAEEPLPDLRPGQSAAVFGRIAPAAGASRRGVSGVFAWRDEDGAEHAGSILIAEIPAETGARRALAYGGHVVLFLRDLVKDLAWPIVLALLGWYLKQRDDRRERQEQAAARAREDAKAAEEARERREREASEARDRLQVRFEQTWNLMLPKSHRNAERHYMPLQTTIDEIFRSSALLRDGKALPARRLWSVLRLFRTMRALVRSIGGFYLRDMEAERLAALCWTHFYVGAEVTLGRRELEVALDAMSLQETLDAFLRRMDSRPPQDADVAGALAALDARLQGWTDLDGHLPLLKLLSLILSYEVNRTYELWYRSPATFDEADFREALKALAPRAAQDPDLKDLLDALDRYPDKVRAHQESLGKRLEGAADGI